MAENKKISELTRVSSLTGAEIVPFAKDGSNGAVSTAKLKEYAQPDLSAITTALGGKVDKVTGKGLSTNDYTDEDKAKLTALPTNEQFGIVGWVSKLNGQFTVESVYRSSELLPLNHNYDLVFVAKALNNAASVSFYTANGTWISSVQKTTTAESTIPKSEFPANAVFVRFTAVAAEISSCYYKNGPSIESREGAASEAIQASITAAVDEELIAEATAAGAVFNRNSGYFELNTLTDITASQMRTIMAAGARQSSTLNEAYIMSTIRTHLPRVGDGQAAIARSTFRTCYFLEAVEMPNLILQSEVFFGCNRLRSVNWKGVPIYDLNNTANANFQGCSKLVELRGSLRSNFGFNIADSPLLSLASFQYMVNNAYNTAPITVTVHPDVYAKLTATEHSAQARSNLVLKSDVPITSAKYPMAEYALNEVPEPGEVLTVTVWGTPSEGCNMYMACFCGDVGTEGVMTEISTGVWQRTIRVKGKSGPTGVLYLFSVPNNHQSGHIDKVKICYGLDPNPQWSAPVEMPTDPEAIEAIGWERVMLMAAAKQINFATT